jgi:hypothetical protein
MSSLYDLKIKQDAFESALCKYDDALYLRVSGFQPGHCIFMLAHKLHWPHLRLPSLEKLRVYLVQENLSRGCDFSALRISELQSTHERSQITCFSERSHPRRDEY